MAYSINYVLQRDQRQVDHRVQMMERLSSTVTQLRDDLADLDARWVELVGVDAYAGLQDATQHAQENLSKVKSMLALGLWKEGSGYQVHVDRAIKASTQLADQLRGVLADYQTCASLRGPVPVAVRYQLGAERVAEMPVQARQLAEGFARAADPAERTSYAQQLRQGAQAVASAQARMEALANPGSAANQELDRQIFAGRIPVPAAQVRQESLRRPVAVQHLAEVGYRPAWYGSATVAPLVASLRVFGGADPPPPPKRPMPTMDVCISIEDDAMGYFRGTVGHYRQGEEGADPVSAQSFKIPHTVDAVARCNAELRRSMEVMWDEYGMGLETPYSLEGMRANLRDLAEWGQDAIRRIFDQETLDLLVHYLREAGGTQEKPANVQINAERFFLPWEMLHSPALREGEVESGFWGFRHNIYRTVLDAGRAVGERPVQGRKLPWISLLSEPADSPNQAALLIGLRDRKKIVLNKLARLESWAEEDQELLALRTFCGQRADVLHVGCHAFAQPDDRDSYFQVDHAFQLRAAQLMRLDEMDDLGQDWESGVVLQGRPVILLNACNTGITPRSTADFVRIFLRELGASGVIATEYDLPEAFAVQFAARFYEGLLEGCTVGEALLSTRRYFLHKLHNPLGLLYSAYVEPEIRITTGGGD